jgi:centromere protein C
LAGRRTSGPALPRIKEIVRIDTPLQTRKRKAPSESDGEDNGKSDAGEVWAEVISYGNGDETEKCKVGVAKSVLKPQPLQGSKVRFEKVFVDGDYASSGIMDIAVGGIKGVKPTKYSFMTFAVMSGKVEVKIHRTAFIIGEGGMFMVPRCIIHRLYYNLIAGNYYSIANVGKKDCRLFFSQAVEQGEPPTSQDKQEDS